MASTHCDYVADEREIEPGTFDIGNYDEAAALVDDYLTRRVYDVLDKWHDRPVLMLSGGIDSILLATYVAEIAPDAIAATYAHPEDSQAQRELSVARAVADTLGLEHFTVSYGGGAKFAALLRRVRAALDTTEPWEVLAGVVLKAVDESVGSPEGAIFSGAGADALFMGGQEVDFGGDPVAAWDSAMRANITSEFTRHRFIPDFYGRLIDNHERHVLVWQTHEAVDLAQRIDPRLIRGARLDGDKELFRLLARDRGLDVGLVSAEKNPIQMSSGGVAAVVSGARSVLSREYGEETYPDPRTESLAFTVSRLHLQKLALGEGLAAEAETENK